MLSFLSFSLIIWLLSFSISLIIKEKLGRCLPFCAMALIIVEFILTIITSSISIGVCFCCIAILILLIFTIVKNKKGIIEHFNDYCCHTTIIFVIFICVVMLIAYLHGTQFMFYDEYNFWGLMCEDLFNNDYFYVTEGSNTFYHNEYPPIISMLETFGCFITGSYSIHCLYCSLWLFMLLLFFPIIPEKRILDINSNKPVLKRLLSIFMSVIFIFCLSLFISYASDDGRSYFWTSIYQDTVMALIAGLGLYISVNKDNQKIHWIAEGIILVFLLFIKQIAVVFIFGILLACFLNIFTNKNLKKAKLKPALILLSSMMLMIVLYAAWALLYTNSYAGSHSFKVLANFDLSIINNFLSLFSEKFSTDYSYIINDFLNKFMYDNAQFSILGITSFQLFIISFALMIILATINIIKKKNIICSLSTILCPIIVCFLYFAALVYSLIFYNFNEGGWGQMYSVFRYTGTLCAFLNIYSLYLFVNLFSKNYVTIVKVWCSVIICCCVLFIISPATYMSSIQLRQENVRNYLSENIDLIAQDDKNFEEPLRISNNVSKYLKENFPKDSKIFVDQDFNDFYKIKINYDVRPIRFNPYSLMVVDQYINDGNTFPLNSYDYFYVGNSPEIGKEKYKQAFNIDVEENTLYSITCVDGKIQLNAMQKLDLFK